MPVFDLSNKRVIITGAAGGLGRAFAEGFARAGAAVVAADINAAGAKETAALIRAAGGIAHGIGLDVTRAEQAARVAEFAHTTLGGIDALVNNAAIYNGLRRARFEEIEEEEEGRVTGGQYAPSEVLQEFKRYRQTAHLPHVHLADSGTYFLCELL